MPTQDELLRRIAAAAIPRKLGRVYSRYGEPAPVLGRERPTAPHAPGATGRPGSSQQLRDLSELSPEETRALEMAQKYEEQPDPRDLAAARAERGESSDYDEMSDSMRSLVDQYGATTPGLEDLLHDEPDISDQEARNFVEDHARSGIGWEDWRDQYRAEKEAQ